MWMQLGSSGPLVRSWQQFLMAQQLLQGAELVDTGAGAVFDEATAAATRRYQSEHGMRADGIVGEQTLRQAQKDGYAAVAVLPEYTLLYGLRSGASDDWEHPAALVHAPSAFTPSALSVVVYLHGIKNNIENVVRATPADEAFPVADLLGQLGRARRSALLVVPELHYNFHNADPGRLAAPGALRSLLDEIFARLPAPLDGLQTTEIGRLVLISHSGGYHAAAAMALGGGLRVDELYLLDSLYGHEEAFAAFLTDTLSELASSAADERRLGQARRFVNLYTRGGGTAEQSRVQGQKARTAAARLQLPEALVFTSDEPLAPEALTDAKVVIQRVAVGHSELPQTFIAPLLQRSGLAEGPG